jgi:hypothetical protein
MTQKPHCMVVTVLPCSTPTPHLESPMGCRIAACSIGPALLPKRNAMQHISDKTLTNSKTVNTFPNNVITL